MVFILKIALSALRQERVGRAVERANLLFSVSGKSSDITISGNYTSLFN
jgi:hypothetical protein